MTRDEAIDVLIGIAEGWVENAEENADIGRLPPHVMRAGDDELREYLEGEGTETRDPDGSDSWEFTTAQTCRDFFVAVSVLRPSKD